MGQPLNYLLQNDLAKVSGREAHGFHFILRSFAGIDQFRFIQEGSEHLVLQLASQRGFSPASLLQLRSQFMEHLSEPVRLDIQLVDFIWEDTPKFKTFISRLPQAGM